MIPHSRKKTPFFRDPWRIYRFWVLWTLSMTWQSLRLTLPELLNPGKKRIHRRSRQRTINITKNGLRLSGWWCFRIKLGCLRKRRSPRREPRGLAHSTSPATLTFMKSILSRRNSWMSMKDSQILLCPLLILRNYSQLHTTRRSRFLWKYPKREIP